MLNSVFGAACVEINKNTPCYPDRKVLYLSTFHAAKGLEFDNVLVPFLSSDSFPDPELLLNATNYSDAYADELKLLYVAVTRSRYGLFMTYSGKISPLLPPGSNNCQYFEEDEL